MMSSWPVELQADMCPWNVHRQHQAYCLDLSFPHVWYLKSCWIPFWWFIPIFFMVSFPFLMSNAYWNNRFEGPIASGPVTSSRSRYASDLVGAPGSEQQLGYDRRPWFQGRWVWTLGGITWMMTEALFMETYHFFGWFDWHLSTRPLMTGLFVSHPDQVSSQLHGTSRPQKAGPWTQNGTCQDCHARMQDINCLHTQRFKVCGVVNAMS